MPSPFYRQSNGGMGGGGSVSEAAGKGALALFGEIKTTMVDIESPILPSKADEAAAAKAAADAYAGAGKGIAKPTDGLLQGKMEIPQFDLGSGVGDKGMPDLAGSDISKAINDLLSGMGDVLNQAISSPIGFLGSILSFLFKLFTEIATTTIEMLNEIARAAVAAIEEAAKKQLEAAQSAASASGLQPLELFNQSATTNTVLHALRSSGT